MKTLLAHLGISRRNVGLLVALTFVLGFLLGAIALSELTGGEPGTPPQPASISARNVTRSNGATLALAALQDSDVRVTVDDTVAFSGTVRTGDTPSWQGASRVQLWTSNPRALTVTVNGYHLGTLSDALGHPEWTTIDWGWPAGWHP